MYTSAELSKNGISAGRTGSESPVLRRLIYCTVIFIGCMGSSCEDSYVEDGPDDPPPTNPDTVLNVIADRWVFVTAGDRVTVKVDTRTNNRRGRTLPTDIEYTIGLIRGGDARAVIADNFSASYAFDYSIRATESPQSALLTIDTDPLAQPGVYIHKIDVDGLPSDRSYLAGFTVNPPAQLGVAVIPTGGHVKTGAVQKVEAGLHHSLALLDDGTVWAWGHNEFGQLGDGTHIDRMTPGPVQGFTAPVVDVAAGDNHSLALQEDGRVFAWGLHDQKQLAWSYRDESRPGCPNDFQVDTRDETHSLAREVIDGTHGAACDWTVESINDVVDIAAGRDHSLILRSGGVVWSFGDNDNGELAHTVINGEPVLPIESVFGAVSAITAGDDFSLALLTDGTVIGWGANHLNQLGANNLQDHLSAIDVPFIGGVQQIEAGGSFAVARVNGETGFRGWGHNFSGQLGDGTTDTRDAPRPTATHLPISKLAAGSHHAVAVLVNGETWAWGQNLFGQMGGASTEESQTFPVRVPVPATVSDVAAGGFHSLAEDHICGTVYAWGQNFYGQLGHSFLREIQEAPLPVYGLGESGIGTNCSVALRVFQREGGSVTSDPAGFDAPGCAGPCAAEFTVGEIVALTAIPDAGYAFAGWRGDCAVTSSGAVALLSMTESKNCIVEYEQVGIVNQPPTASFSFAPASPLINEMVDFDASASSDDSAIVSYEWDFTDDGVFDTTGVTSMFTYTAPAEYTVRLRVTDGGGLTHETAQTVTVSDSGGGTPMFFSIYIQFPGDGNGIVNVNPPNLNLPSPAFCTGSTCVIEELAGGEDYLLTATPGDPASFFLGWNIVPNQCDSLDAGTGTCTITLNSDRSVLARFEGE